jgi:hypothetical protein
MFETYLDVVSATAGMLPGFVTRNPLRFFAFCRSAGVDPRTCVVMTPANPVGFQMSPSRRVVEDSLLELHGQNVIAMSILGGGLVRFQTALKYLRTLRGVHSIAVGVSTVEHAQSTFQALKAVWPPKVNDGSDGGSSVSG